MPLGSKALTLKQYTFDAVLQCLLMKSFDTFEWNVAVLRISHNQQAQISP
jgi:hypothetical protein